MTDELKSFLEYGKKLHDTLAKNGKIEEANFVETAMNSAIRNEDAAISAYRQDGVRLINIEYWERFETLAVIYGSKCGDEFYEFFNTIEEAEKFANMQWNHLTPLEQKRDYVLLAKVEALDDGYSVWIDEEKGRDVLWKRGL